MAENNKSKILHLACYFSGYSPVYKYTFENIDKLGVEQTIYVPHRYIGVPREIEFTQENSILLMNKLYNNFDRIAYFRKINKAFKDIQRTANVEDYDCIHAHTWFTDGGIAYELYKKYKIPYIITIRNTDINTFVKYFYHIRSYGVQILKNAAKVIFVSPSYEKKVMEFGFISGIKSDIQSKSVVLPNGIDDFWIQNHANSLKNRSNEKIGLIYIGNFSKGKNIDRLIDAIDSIKKQGYDVKLEIVGGGKEYSKKLVERIEKHKNILFHGKVGDKKNLADIIKRNDIFVMPSCHETFGLVYIEALSQGIPVVYSKNEGIDGFHNENIGEAVNPYDVKSISQAILKIHHSYEKYDFVPKEIVKEYNWINIAQKLIEIYQAPLK